MSLPAYTPTLTEIIECGLDIVVFDQSSGGCFSLNEEQVMRYMSNKNSVLAEINGLPIETYEAFLSIGKGRCIELNTDMTPCKNLVAFPMACTPRAFAQSLESGDWSLFLCGAHNPHSKPVHRPIPKNKNKAGFIYLVQEESRGFFKIGRAIDLHNRIKTFHVKLPFKINLHYSFKCDDYVQAEKTLHECFAESRIDGEWFALRHEDMELIKNPDFLAVHNIKLLHDNSEEAMQGGTL